MTNDAAAGGELNLFSGQPQYEQFAHVREHYPVSAMVAAASPYDFPAGAPADLPTNYTFDGETRNLHCLLGATHTSALLVLKRGQVRFERYWLTGDRKVQWISMSVAKSFVSALVGIALSEGLIESLQDPIDRYAPHLSGSAYAGVRIKDVLQMSSGVRFDEDYSNPDSEIFRLSAAMAPGGSLDDFMASTEREVSPGTRCLYASSDTQALAMLIVGATGRSLTDYMQEKLYTPLGMESPGFWMTDSRGREMAYAGLLMTARDFAKLGELYRNGGVWGRQQIVPADYVADSVRADAPHVEPGGPIVSDHAFGPGYGYQWWLPEGDQGEFSAIGVYNQFVYVDPRQETVIVKLSANPAYGTSTREADNRDLENLTALRAISRAID